MKIFFFSIYNCRSITKYKIKNFKNNNIKQNNKSINKKILIFKTRWQVLLNENFIDKKTKLMNDQVIKTCCELS